MPPKKKTTDTGKTAEVEVIEAAPVVAVAVKPSTGKKAPPAKIEVSKTDKLALTQAALHKVIKEDPDMIVKVDPSLLTEPLPHISSGSIILDYLIGGKPNDFGVSPCQGFPKGRLVNIYGAESSGKTTIALMCAADVCRNGGTVVYVDWEHELDIAYAKALGVPVLDSKKFMLVQPNTLEAGMKVLWTAANAGVELLVIDSIGAGVPEDIYNQAIEDQGHIGRVGLMAAKWSGFLPKFKQVVARTQATVIGIAQTRKKIETKGHGGPDIEVQGGQAWRFYSAVRIMLRRVQSERQNLHDKLTNKKVEGVVTGGIIKAKLDKCKVSASAHHEAEYYIRQGYGIDDVRSILDIAIAYNIVVKGGAWYTLDRPNGEQIRANGVEQLRAKVLADPGAWNELKALTLGKLSATSGTVLIGAGVAEDADDAAGTPLLDDDLSWMNGPTPTIPDDLDADGSDV